MSGGAVPPSVPSAGRRFSSIYDARSMSGTSEAPGIVNALLRALLRDRASGAERTLDEYQRMFPGFENLVAREHARLHDGSAAHADEPQVIGHYRLIDEIGRGGQAVVWLAEDTRLPRRVALKVLRGSGLLQSSEARSRFLVEARAASRLDDPLICPVYEVGEDGEHAFIAMRYVPGISLARMIASARSGNGAGELIDLATDSSHERSGAAGNSGSAPSQRDRRHRLLRLFERVARSLHAAHEAGIIHRDIKPGNLMITPDGDPVILDFGLARDESANSDLTLTGDVLGTPAYMAPEQHRGQRCDRRADVWSLGATLYEAITLERPFTGATQHELSAAILNSEVRDPRRGRSWVSRELAAVLETALEKSVERRYRTMSDFADDLARLQRFEPVKARRAGLMLRAFRFGQRHPVWSIATGVTCAALVVLVILLGRMSSQAERLGAWKDAMLALESRDATPRVALERALAAARREPQAETNTILLQILNSCREEWWRPFEEKSFYPRGAIRADPIGGGFLIGVGAKRVVDLDPATGRTRRELATLMDDPFVAVAQHADRTAVFGRGGDVEVRETSSWNLVRTIASTEPPREAETSIVLDAEISDDGRFGAVCGTDALLRLFDLENGVELLPKERHTGRIDQIAFSPDGKRLAVRAKGREDVQGSLEVWLWDVARATVALRLDLEGNQAMAFDFDKTGARLAVIAFDDWAWAFDTAPGRQWTKIALGQIGRWIAVSPRGDAIVTGSREGLIVSDAATGRRIRTHPLNDRSPHFGAFSPDGTRLGVFVRDKSVRFYSTDTWDEVAVGVRTETNVTHVAWSKDGSRLVTEDADSLRSWKPGFRDYLPEFFGHREAVEQVAFSADGGRVFTASRDHTARVFDRATGAELAVFRHEMPVRKVRVAPAGERVLTVADDSTVRTWRVSAERPEVEMRGGDSPLVDAAYFDHGRSVVSVDETGVARTFDAESGALRTTFRAQAAAADVVLVDDTRGWLVVGGRDRTLEIHDLSPTHEGALIRLLEPTPGDRGGGVNTFHGVSDIALDPLTNRLYSSHEDRPFGYWMLDGTWRRVIDEKFAAHSRGMIGIDPLGRFVIAAHGSLDYVWLLDVDTLVELPLPQAEMPATSTTTVRFRADGRFALIASKDGSIRLWDANRREQHLVIRHAGGAILDAVFSPDGAFVLSGALDGAVRMWPVDPVGAATHYLARGVPR